MKFPDIEYFNQFKNLRTPFYYNIATNTTPKISIIITTRIGERPIFTLNSLKKLDLQQIEIIIEHDYKGKDFSRTKNRGAKRAKGEILIFMDDDIAFDKDFFYKFIQAIEPKTLVGLSYKPTLNWIIARVIGIKRDDFWYLGGFFDPMSYMCEDIELAIRAQYFGFKLNKFPVESVVHLDTPTYKRLFVRNLHNNWNGIFVSLRYHNVPICNWFKRKNPFHLCFRLIALIYWGLYLKIIDKR